MTIVDFATRARNAAPTTLLVATLIVLAPATAMAQVLRCRIDGHLVYTNLYTHCPPSRRGAAEAPAKAARRTAHQMPPRHAAAPSHPAERAGQRNRPHPAGRPAPRSWWVLLGGPIAPEGVPLTAGGRLRWQGVEIRYDGIDQMQLARRLLEHDKQALFLPELAGLPAADRLLRSLAAMTITRLTVTAYRPELFAALRKRGMAQVPAPVAMLRIDYRDRQGKAAARFLPFGASAGRLYISLPYPTRAAGR
ncbi:MAG: hypothetical protein D6682_01530 [Zetaproteobacteria bacterium]|nr:MAG: hypothetical protein D6682_01530 [Zetaproteobacteria bacterium]